MNQPAQGSKPWPIPQSPSVFSRSTGLLVLKRQQAVTADRKVWSRQALEIMYSASSESVRNPSSEFMLTAATTQPVDRMVKLLGYRVKKNRTPTSACHNLRPIVAEVNGKATWGNHGSKHWSSFLTCDPQAFRPRFDLAGCRLGGLVLLGGVNDASVSLRSTEKRIRNHTSKHWIPFSHLVALWALSQDLRPGLLSVAPPGLVPFFFCLPRLTPLRQAQGRLWVGISVAVFRRGFALRAGLACRRGGWR